MQKHIHTLLWSLLLLLPTGVQAATVDALDTIAGIATEIVIEELTPDTQTQLTIHSPIGESFSHTLNVGDQGIAHTWVAGNDLQVAGEYTLIIDGALTDTLTVHPDTVDLVASFVDAPKTAVAVGEEITVTVVLTDRFGNALSGRSAELVSSRADDLVQALTRETDDYGEQQFLVRATAPGPLSLRAIDLISGQALRSATEIAAGDLRGGVGGPIAQQQFYRGNPYAASILNNGSQYRAQAAGDPPRFDHIEIEVVGKTPREEIGPDGRLITVIDMEQQKAESMMLTAYDQYGNRYLDFSGYVYLATTDSNATLPAFGVYEFIFEDEGSKMFTLGLKFAEKGRQQMVLTDSPDEIPADLSLALGSLTVDVIQKEVVQQAAQKITIDAPRENDLFAETEVLIEGRGPSFVNIIIRGGKKDIEGETDREGNFSIPITLDPTKVDHVISVEDKDANTNIDEVAFSIDITPPEIISITFTPENPLEETDVLAIVQSEPGLEDITMTFNGETFTMTSSDKTSGKYQVLLFTPEAGSYDAIVNAADAQGNASEQKKSLPVELRGLPQVQSVVAEGQINAIALSWDPITDDTIDAYRIYVGTAPDEFIYTLDTDRPTAAATVAGLRPGTTYYFGVTALEGPRESDEKSDIADATVLGVQLEVTPGDGSLFVEWTSLQQEIPLANFILEYSTEIEALGDPSKEDMVEKKTLNGELRAFTLRDLMNGITYYLKLTPITTTGEALEDLAALGQGTPIGAGYTAGTSDPVPFDLRGSAPPTPRPIKEMPLSDEGIPMWMLWSILGVSGALYHLYLRRRKDNQMTVAFLQAMESRYHQ
ncbi:MAG: fibronectin type III domain-containing protein [bacterium]|nr:fibronectin type III domain-containing protein [bacterium]